ncbi:LuxR C-terminal-related transcriptional regulator [Nocardia jejuensis]|uniref:LuxR C-terminal-related transcriptional regulator n=1 Tax=Nocardia jejuensis TaxID=328049 RepID=UPI0012FC1719|nr:LuxR C-terminal-related transcriptional regulator [Nocardia jejuensis]
MNEDDIAAFLDAFDTDLPEPENADPNALGNRAEGEHGRGARIVTDAAAAVGTIVTGGGKSVWVEYRTPPRSYPATPADVFDRPRGRAHSADDAVANLPWTGRGRIVEGPLVFHGPPGDTPGVGRSAPPAPPHTADTALASAQRDEFTALAELRRQHGQFVFDEVTSQLENNAAPSDRPTPPLAELLVRVVFDYAEASRWAVPDGTEPRSWLTRVTEMVLDQWRGRTPTERRLMGRIAAAIQRGGASGPRELGALSIFLGAVRGQSVSTEPADLSYTVESPGVRTARRSLVVGVAAQLLEVENTARGETAAPGLHALPIEKVVEFIHLAECALAPLLAVENGSDLHSDAFLESAGSTMHNRWLQREWRAAEPELRVPYDDPGFPEEQRARYRDLLRAAIAVVVADRSIDTSVTDPFEHCTTTDQIAAELRRRHHLAVVGFDLPGLSVDIARELASTIHQLLTKYPQIQLLQIDVGAIPTPSELATSAHFAGDEFTYPLTRSITLSNEAAHHPEEFRSAWAAMVAAGSAVGPADRPAMGLMLREFGSAVANGAGRSITLPLAECYETTENWRPSGLVEWQLAQFRSYGAEGQRLDSGKAAAGGFAATEFDASNATLGEGLVHELLTTSLEETAEEYEEFQRLASEYLSVSPAEQQTKLELIAAAEEWLDERVPADREGEPRPWFVGSENPGISLSTVREIIDAVRYMVARFPVIGRQQIRFVPLARNTHATWSMQNSDGKTGISINELRATTPGTMRDNALRFTASGFHRGNPEQPFAALVVHEMTHALRGALPYTTPSTYTVLTTYYQNEYGITDRPEFTNRLGSQLTGYGLQLDPAQPRDRNLAASTAFRRHVESEEAEAESNVAYLLPGSGPSEIETLIAEAMAAAADAEAERLGLTPVKTAYEAWLSANGGPSAVYKDTEPDPPSAPEYNLGTNQAIAAQTFATFGVEILGLDKVGISVDCALAVRNAVADAWFEDPDALPAAVVITDLSPRVHAAAEWILGAYIVFLNENDVTDPDFFARRTESDFRDGRKAAPTGNPVYDTLRHEFAHLRDREDLRSQHAAPISASRYAELAESRATGALASDRRFDQRQDFMNQLAPRAFGFLHEFFIGLRARGELPADTRFDIWLDQLDGYSRENKEDPRFPREGKPWAPVISDDEIDPDADRSVFFPPEALAEANNSFGRSAPTDPTHPVYGLRALLNGRTVEQALLDERGPAEERPYESGSVPATSGFVPSVAPDGTLAALVSRWHSMTAQARTEFRRGQEPIFTYYDDNGRPYFVLDAMARMLDEQLSDPGAANNADTAGNPPPLRAQTPLTDEQANNPDAQAHTGSARYSKPDPNSLPTPTNSSNLDPSVFHHHPPGGDPDAPEYPWSDETGSVTGGSPSFTVTGVFGPPGSGTWSPDAVHGRPKSATPDTPSDDRQDDAANVSSPYALPKESERLRSLRDAVATERADAMVDLSTVVSDDQLRRLERLERTLALLDELLAVEGEQHPSIPAAKLRLLHAFAHAVDTWLRKADEALTVEAHTRQIAPTDAQRRQWRADATRRVANAGHRLAQVRARLGEVQDTAWTESSSDSLTAIEPDVLHAVFERIAQELVTAAGTVDQTDPYSTESGTAVTHYRMLQRAFSALEDLTALIENPRSRVGVETLDVLIENFHATASWYAESDNLANTDRTGSTPTTAEQTRRLAAALADHAAADAEVRTLAAALAAFGPAASVLIPPPVVTTPQPAPTVWPESHAWPTPQMTGPQEVPPFQTWNEAEDRSQSSPGSALRQQPSICVNGYNLLPLDQHFEDQGSMAAVSNVGLVHEGNEDWFAIGSVEVDGKPVRIAVIDDGVSSTGLHGEPDAYLAAQLAAYTARDYLTNALSAIEPGIEWDPEQLAQEAVRAAEQAVLGLADAPRYLEARKPPGCTIILAVVEEDQATLCWSGDSRGYDLPLDGRTAQRLTEDDSLVPKLMAPTADGRPGIDEGEALGYDMAHALTQFLGKRENDTNRTPELVRPHTVKVSLVGKKGAVLICTDGMWNETYKAQALGAIVLAALSEAPGNLGAGIKALEKRAMDTGAEDNLSGVLIAYGGRDQGKPTSTRSDHPPTTSPVTQPDGSGPVAEPAVSARSRARTPWASPRAQAPVPTQDPESVNPTAPSGGGRDDSSPRLPEQRATLGAPVAGTGFENPWQRFGFETARTQVNEFAVWKHDGGGAQRGKAAARKMARGRDLFDQLNYHSATSDRISTVTGPDDPIEDGAMAYIAGSQGFDALPALAGADEVDAMVATGCQELFRGVRDPRYLAEFRTGRYLPAIPFSSSFGIGIYASTDRDIALGYADDQPECVDRMVLRPEARTIDFALLLDDMTRATATLDNEESDLSGREQTASVRARRQELSVKREVLSDAGRFAAVRGYDAYVVREPGAAEVWIIVNRSAVVVAVAPAPTEADSTPKTTSTIPAESAAAASKDVARIKPSRTIFDGAEMNFRPESDEFWQRRVEVVILKPDDHGVFLDSEKRPHNTRAYSGDTFILLRSGTLITTPEAVGEHPHLLLSYLARHADENERRDSAMRNAPSIAAGFGYMRMVEGRPELIGAFSGLFFGHNVRSPKFWVQLRYWLRDHVNLSTIKFAHGDELVSPMWWNPARVDGPYSAAELIPDPGSVTDRTAAAAEMLKHFRGGDVEFWVEAERARIPEAGGISVDFVVQPVLGEPARFTFDVNPAGSTRTARIRDFDPGPETERTYPACAATHDVLTRWLHASGYSWSEDSQVFLDPAARDPNGRSSNDTQRVAQPPGVDAVAPNPFAPERHRLVGTNRPRQLQQALWFHHDPRNGLEWHGGVRRQPQIPNLETSAPEKGRADGTQPADTDGADAASEQIRTLIAAGNTDAAVELLHHRFDGVVRRMAAGLGPRTVDRIVDDVCANATRRFAQITDRTIDEWITRIVAPNVIAPHREIAEFWRRIQVFLNRGAREGEFDLLPPELGQAETSELRGILEAFGHQQTHLRRFWPTGRGTTVPPNDPGAEPPELWDAARTFSVAVASQRGVRLQIPPASDRLSDRPAVPEPSQVRSVDRPRWALSLGLTDRHVDVVHLLDTWMTNQQMADALGISRKTLQRRLTMIYQAFGTRARPAIVELTRQWRAAYGEPEPDVPPAPIEQSAEPSFDLLPPESGQVETSGLRGTDLEIPPASDRLSDGSARPERSQVPGWALNLRLADRHVDVVHLLDRGMTNQQMADALGISPKTLKERLGIIYRAFGTNFRPTIAERTRQWRVAYGEPEPDVPPTPMKQTTPSSAQTPRPLSPRETQVFDMAAAGMSNRGIADSLAVTPDTVDSYLARARRKLGLPARTTPAENIAAGQRPVDTGTAGAPAVSAAGHTNRPDTAMRSRARSLEEADHVATELRRARVLRDEEAARLGVDTQTLTPGSTQLWRMRRESAVACGELADLLGVEPAILTSERVRDALGGVRDELAPIRRKGWQPTIRAAQPAQVLEWIGQWTRHLAEEDAADTLDTRDLLRHKRVELRAALTALLGLALPDRIADRAWGTVKDPVDGVALMGTMMNSAELGKLAAAARRFDVDTLVRRADEHNRLTVRLHRLHTEAARATSEVASNSPVPVRMLFTTAVPSREVFLENYPEIPVEKAFSSVADIVQAFCLDEEGARAVAEAYDLGARYFAPFFTWIADRMLPRLHARAAENLAWMAAFVARDGHIIAAAVRGRDPEFFARRCREVLMSRPLIEMIARDYEAATRLRIPLGASFRRSLTDAEQARVPGSWGLYTRYLRERGIAAGLPGSAFTLVDNGFRGSAEEVLKCLYPLSEISGEYALLSLAPDDPHPESKRGYIFQLPADFWQGGPARFLPDDEMLTLLSNLAVSLMETLSQGPSKSVGAINDHGFERQPPPNADRRYFPDPRDERFSEDRVVEAVRTAILLATAHHAQRGGPGEVFPFIRQIRSWVLAESTGDPRFMALSSALQPKWGVQVGPVVRTSVGATRGSGQHRAAPAAGFEDKAAGL